MRKCPCGCGQQRLAGRRFAKQYAEDAYTFQLLLPPIRRLIEIGPEGIEIPVVKKLADVGEQQFELLMDFLHRRDRPGFEILGSRVPIRVKDWMPNAVTAAGCVFDVDRPWCHRYWRGVVAFGYPVPQLLDSVFRRGQSEIGFPWPPAPVAGEDDVRPPLEYGPWRNLRERWCISA